ncbi:hypothetical protein NPIL_586091 [Nephila pilipes]|uniref:Uncharacterized protein n=1 Tax=Nephila pilipes TaxID=299642 RepID=A0A8X6P989_NEPPI|nr:hypothetical protein NPIL_586091 [Nephila pilipes]
MFQDKLETEVKRRDIERNSRERFAAQCHFVSSANIEKYLSLTDDNLNSYFSAEFQQFHSYASHKYNATKYFKSHAELFEIITEENTEFAFQNVEVGFRIFLVLMVIKLLS